jgi:hypothetical protein
MWKGRPHEHVSHHKIIQKSQFKEKQHFKQKQNIKQKRQYELNKRSYELNKRSYELKKQYLKTKQDDTKYLEYVHHHQTAIDSGLTNVILNKWSEEDFFTNILFNYNPLYSQYGSPYNINKNSNCDQCGILLKHTHCKCKRLVLKGETCNHCPACHGNILHVHCKCPECLGKIVLDINTIDCFDCSCRYKHHHCINCTKRLDMKCLRKSMQRYYDDNNIIGDKTGFFYYQINDEYYMFNALEYYKNGKVWKYICDDCIDMGG